MAWPTVTIKILNMMQGAIPGVEQHFLFVGHGNVTGTERNLINIDSTSDIEELLKSKKASDSLIKTVLAAQQNGKQNWTAGVMIIDQSDDWQDIVDAANEVASFEAVVLDVPMTAKENIEQANTYRETLKSKTGREIFIIGCTPAIDTSADNGQTWEAYVTAQAAITKDVAAPYVTLVPMLHADGTTLGKYAGRLANKEVSIADSPARVKTGSVLGITELATDKDGKACQLATLKTLHQNRLAVPMWYPDYPGQYWTTGITLDVPGGDLQDIRHVRVLLKAARKVRVRAIARIADRELNSTPGSMESAKLYFTQDLRRMARNVKIGDYTFPGEIKTPLPDDISITWLDSEHVQIMLKVTPYECPVKITIGIMLNKRLGE
jgi:hypothetical protein